MGYFEDTKEEEMLTEEEYFDLTTVCWHMQWAGQKGGP